MRRPFFFCAVSFLALTVAFVACTGAVTTTGFTPVTSIMLRGESVIPPGQCGNAPNQFAKYTAVITAIVSAGDDAGTVLSSTPLGGQTSPCYADTMFANLHVLAGSPPLTQNLSFRIDVFLWTADAYSAASNITSIEARLHDTNTDVVAKALSELAGLAPKKVCSATEVSNVQTVARCDPPDAGAEGGMEAGSEAGMEAGAEAGTDSGIADAGPG